MNKRHRRKMHEWWKNQIEWGLRDKDITAIEYELAYLECVLEIARFSTWRSTAGKDFTKFIAKHKRLVKLRKKYESQTADRIKQKWDLPFYPRPRDLSNES